MSEEKVLDIRALGEPGDSLRLGLLDRVVGQDEAVASISEVVQVYRAGMRCPGRPIANLLFVGPTGVGKTRSVEAVAEVLAGDSRAMVKIDCAEFQHSHEIAKLIGSPPGYLGHRETHPLLSQEVLSQHHAEGFDLSIVLFDEIEKSSDSLWSLLLGIMDKATLTLGDNRRVDFSKSIVFMTSNLGVKDVEALPRSASPAQADKVYREAVRERFTPEFINRIDRMVTFRPLGESEIRSILDIEIGRIAERAKGSRSPITLEVAPSAKEALLERGVSKSYGARHLRRLLEKTLTQPLSNVIVSGQVFPGAVVGVEASAPGKLRFTRKGTSVDSVAA